MQLLTASFDEPMSDTFSFNGHWDLIGQYDLVLQLDVKTAGSYSPVNRLVCMAALEPLFTDICCLPACWKAEDDSCDHVYLRSPSKSDRNPTS